MAKFCIDPGHGGVQPGAVNTYVREKDIDLTVSLKLKELLVLNGHEVLLTRENDIDVSLDQRCIIANNWKADYFISVHHNAGGGNGYEAIYSVIHGISKSLAEDIATEFATTGQNPHGVGTYDRLGSNGKDYYCVIRQTNMPAIITEYGFMDSIDYTAFDTTAELYEEARAIARGCQKYLGQPFKSDVQPVPNPTPDPTPTILYRIIIDGKQVMALSIYDNAVAEVQKRIDAGEGQVGKVQRNTDSVDMYTYQKPVPDPTPEPPKPVVIKHAIAGVSIATAYQMIQYVLKTNPDPKIDIDLKTFAQTYLDEGAAEGIRGDLAFAQSIKETARFDFGGLVLPEQHNYAGIGATNDSAIGKGAWFNSAQLGIRAQIQHLKAYASTEPLSKECIDPRFDLISKGSAPYVEDLAGKWAVPGYNPDKYGSLDEALAAGESYGQNVWSILNAILTMPDENPIPYPIPNPDPEPEPQPDPIDNDPPQPDPVDPTPPNKNVLINLLNMIVELLKSLLSIFKRD